MAEAALQREQQASSAGLPGPVRQQDLGDVGDRGRTVAAVCLIHCVQEQVDLLYEAERSNTQYGYHDGKPGLRRPVFRSAPSVFCHGSGGEQQNAAW